jgi:hypothetical protein
MRKYEAPKIQTISRGDLDIICTSEFILPIIPLTGKITVDDEKQSL